MVKDDETLEMLVDYAINVKGFQRHTKSGKTITVNPFTRKGDKKVEPITAPRIKKPEPDEPDKDGPKYKDPDYIARQKKLYFAGKQAKGDITKGTSVSTLGVNTIDELIGKLKDTEGFKMPEDILKTAMEYNRLLRELKDFIVDNGGIKEVRANFPTLYNSKIRALAKMLEDTYESITKARTKTFKDTYDTFINGAQAKFQLDHIDDEGRYVYSAGIEISDNLLLYLDELNVGLNNKHENTDIGNYITNMSVWVQNGKIMADVWLSLNPDEDMDVALTDVDKKLTAMFSDDEYSKAGSELYVSLLDKQQYEDQSKIDKKFEEILENDETGEYYNMKPVDRVNKVFDLALKELGIEKYKEPIKPKYTRPVKTKTTPESNILSKMKKSGDKNRIYVNNALRVMRQDVGSRLDAGISSITYDVLYELSHANSQFNYYLKEVINNPTPDNINELQGKEQQLTRRVEGFEQTVIDRVKQYFNKIGIKPRPDHTLIDDDEDANMEIEFGIGNTLDIVPDNAKMFVSTLNGLKPITSGVFGTDDFNKVYKYTIPKNAVGFYDNGKIYVDSSKYDRADTVTHELSHAYHLEYLQLFHPKTFKAIERLYSEYKKSYIAIGYKESSRNSLSSLQLANGVSNKPIPREYTLRNEKEFFATVFPIYQFDKDDCKERFPELAKMIEKSLNPTG